MVFASGQRVFVLQSRLSAYSRTFLHLTFSRCTVEVRRGVLNVPRHGRATTLLPVVYSVLVLQ
jgi:hypothetical protein